MSDERDLRKQRKVSADVTIDPAGLATSDYQLPAPNKTVVNIPASITEVMLQATNTLRKEVTIFNNSNSVLYVLYGSGVTSTNYSFKLAMGDSAHLNDYRGDIKGVFTSAIGFAMVTETYY